MSERGEAARGQESSLSYASTAAPLTAKPQPQGVPAGALPTSSDPSFWLLLSAMLSGLWGGPERQTLPGSHSGGQMAEHSSPRVAAWLGPQGQTTDDPRPQPAR